MVGTSFQIEVEGLGEINKILTRLENPDFRPLMDALGAEGESQTKRRIDEEKTAPDGTAWKPWSDNYAKTRHSGNSLLQGEGDLVDSIQYEAGDDTVEWGSNVIYAAIHQFGGDKAGKPGIPARPYLGLSNENLDDFSAVATDWAKELLQ